jgi:hypothetical protein
VDYYNASVADANVAIEGLAQKRVHIFVSQVLGNRKFISRESSSTEMDK